ncbi:S-layer homology domain-containing protein, partial [Candidatus Peregrinibacteria bacterium]|nr:S-layer homology domain-containing protein [Candidatus Peregrinibacteria bacterium]
PLIDIQSQEVLFKLPFISKKEIAKLQADAIQWTRDERLELSKWKTAAGCIAPGSDSFANADLCRLVEFDVNNLIETVHANLRTLDEWVLFPKKVWSYRRIESYYLGQIVDYMDAVLEFSGGWIIRNAARVKQWRRSALQIKQTIKTYKLFTDLMIDYQEACDRCKTERLSLMELILKLLVVLPTPPVLPIPKMPDLIVDVSKIQAGVRIAWPDVKFQPELITFPKLPRFSIGIDLTKPQWKQVLPSIPLIPPPPKLPELPSLPPLNLPTLPDIPPPPRLPGPPKQLEPVIKSLGIVFKIYCMIKLGFIPDDEDKLKTKIELITTRGLTPLLPLDLLFTVKTPQIPVNYADQVKVSTMVNLNFDFNQVYDQAAEFARQANSFSSDFSKGINQYTEALSKQVEKYTSPKIRIEEPGINALPLNYDEDKELNNAVGAALQLKSAFAALQEEHEKRSREFAKIPDRLTVEAGMEPFKFGLPRRVPEEGLVLPFQKSLKEYRDHLAAALENNNQLLDQAQLSENFENFSRTLAKMRSPFLNPDSRRYAASRETGVYDSRLLAFQPPVTAPPDISASLPGGAMAGGAAAFAPKTRDIGLFIMDVNGGSKRLINYTLEADSVSRLAHIDIDGDSDEDILYSYGRNVFLKENGRKARRDDTPVFREEDIKFFTVAELMPKGMSPFFPQVTAETSHSASVSFESAGMPELAGFEIVARRSPLFFEEADRSGEEALVVKVPASEKPETALNDLPEGFAYAQVYAVDKDGNRSTAPEKIILAPQVCGDQTPPFANFGRARYKVAIGKTLSLNAEKSFDTESRVIGYALDTDVSADADSDGDKADDRDLWKDLDPASDSDKDGNPANDGDDKIFTLGPYQELGERYMRLTVVDEALNRGYQDITIEVVAPTITLDETALRDHTVAGWVDPPEGNTPITLARFRPGTSSPGWEILRSPSADEGGQYYTNADGKFRVEDLDMRDRLIVRNHEAKIVAEINHRMGIFLKSDGATALPLTYISLLPDVNTDATIDGLDVAYQKSTANRMAGVHLKPMENAAGAGLIFTSLPADNPDTPGAVSVESAAGGAAFPVAVIDVNGSIASAVPNITLRVKSLGLPMKDEVLSEEPVVYEMLWDGRTVAEVLMAVSLPIDEKINIVEAPKAASIRKPIQRIQPKSPFADVDPESAFAKTAQELYKRGIIAGYPSDVRGEILFKPQNPINRAEFTQIALKMLCIVPREEAKKPPSPFLDVLDPSLWFYPAVKEGNIRAFIKGYLAEAREDVSGVKKTPFKPANFITWAEASTVVLAALNEQGIIDVSKANLKAPEGAPWYVPYLEIAKNLRPYMKNPEEGMRDFLITPGEAGLADRIISRRDFAIMAERVLLIHDCQASGKITPPPTPPIDQPPLPLPSEQELNAVLPKEEGMYLLNPPCGNVCPCRAVLGNGADLQPSDIIFAAITGRNGVPIYAKSNEARY